MIPRPPFERTTCSCQECKQCCHDQPGSCAPGDVERIAAHLGKPVQDVLVKFWASPGALVLNRLTGETRRIGTITPRVRDGRCVFLDQDDRCTIHPVAPVGCSCFDTHMDASEGQRRSQWLVKAQTDETYQSLRKTLPTATRYRPKSY